MKTELELKAGAMAQAVQMARAAHVEILQWKDKLECDIISTLSLGFNCCF
jgi:hypothetical protein